VKKWSKKLYKLKTVGKATCGADIADVQITDPIVKVYVNVDIPGSNMEANLIKRQNIKLLDIDWYRHRFENFDPYFIAIVDYK